MYLPVRDVDAGIETIRRHVVVAPLAQPPELTYHAHVTLMHPRSVDLPGRERAWEALQRWRPPVATTLVQQVQIIAAADDRWLPIASFDLTH